MDGYNFNAKVNPVDRIVDELQSLNKSIGNMGNRINSMYRGNRSTGSPYRSQISRSSSYVDKVLDYLKANDDNTRELVDSNNQIRSGVRGLLELFSEKWEEVERVS